MITETTVWQTPLLSKRFDWKAEGAKLEEYVIAPAIKHIVDTAVSSRLAALNPIASGAIGLLLPSIPMDGWDSSLRFNQQMERVLPFMEVPSPFGVGSEVNPAFEESGLVVFARNAPKGAYLFDVRRKNARTDIGQSVTVWVTVTIPDESVFETEWFRLA